MFSLALLQNKVKRAPQAYEAEFQQQLRTFDAQLSIFELSPPKDSKEFGRLVTFLSQVANLYPEDGHRFAQSVKGLLEKSYDAMDPELRRTLLQALILLRNRNQLDPVELISMCFSLFRCRDKNLRDILYKHIVADVRNINKKASNHKLNREVQNVVFSMLEDPSSVAAKRSLQVMVDLYKRRVWTDSRTVNMIADACISNQPKNVAIGLQFFLGIDDKIDALQDEEEDDVIEEALEASTGKSRDKLERAAQKTSRNYSKKTRSRLRKKEKEDKALKKARLAKLAAREVTSSSTAEHRRVAAPRFPAIDLLSDPQGFCEKLFKKLRGSNDHFEVRLLMMNLISRVVGHHKLIMLSFYSFVQRYLTPHQRHVTNILAYLIQASHELVPNEELEPVAKHIANNFINDRSGAEHMAVGLNTIRELVTKVPLLTTGEGMDDFFQDLVDYKAYRRDKSVIIAARSLLNALREINPTILQRRERGKFRNEVDKVLAYGESKVAEGVDGAELLQLLEEEAALRAQNEESEEEDEDDEMEEVEDEEDEEEDEEEEEEEEEEDEEEEKDSTRKSKKRRRSDSNAEEEEEEEGEEDDEDEEMEEDDDEEEEEGKLSAKDETLLEKLRKSKIDQKDRIDAHRIFTEEDFARIRKLKAKLEKEKRDPRARRRVERKREASYKRSMVLKQLASQGFEVEGLDDGEIESDDDPFASDQSSSEEEDEEEEAEGNDGSFDPSNLEGVVRKRRRELAERLASVYEGRNGAHQLQNKRLGGSNNSEKNKNKNFLMVQKSRKVQRKTVSSFREQQMQLKKHIKTLERNKKTVQKIRRRSKKVRK